MTDAGDAFRTDADAIQAYLFGAMARGPIRDRDLKAFFCAAVLGLPIAFFCVAALILWHAFG